MKKQSEIEKYRGYIMEDGIAHIKYELSDIHDIINPLSIKDYEMLSDEFVAFMEKYRLIIPAKAPIILEISGIKLADNEKELIDKTIWSNYCMHMTSADMKARSCVKRSILFLVYMLISIILIFAVEKIKEEIVTSFAYLPFWFFGYRLLIYLIIDCIPMWKDRNWYRRLAAMNLIFSDDNSDKAISADEITNKSAEYLKETDKQLRSNKLVLQYMKDNGIVELGCNAKSIEDIVCTPAIKGREYMSYVLSSYLSQAEPFLSTDSRIRFEIQGNNFNNEEKAAIKQGIENYYGFRIAAEENGALDNKQKIILFSIFVFISAALLFLWGTKVDVAMHEFISMLFWFFADYLLEFILLTHSGHKKNIKILENCRDMEIKYNPTENYVGDNEEV